MPTPTIAQRVGTDRVPVKDYSDANKPDNDSIEQSKLNTSPKRSDIDPTSEKDQSRVQTFYGSDATKVNHKGGVNKSARSKGEELHIPGASVKISPKRDKNSADVS